jgi:hypothetical protein
MLGRLRKSVELELHVEPAAVDAGGEITAAVRGRLLRDVEVEDAHVSLVRTVVYKYDEDEYDEDGTRTVTHRQKDRSVEARVGLDLGSGPPAGGQLSADVRITVPPTAMGTADGKIITVGWELTADVTVHKGRDGSEAQPITVRTPLTGEDLRTLEEATVETCDVAELSLGDVPRNLAGGASVAGTLTINPLKAVSTRAVRVELVRVESVSRAKGKREETVEAAQELSSRTELDQPRSLPFALHVPSSPVPSLSGGSYAVRWYLRGVLDRRMRKDPYVLLPLHVASAAAT